MRRTCKECIHGPVCGFYASLLSTPVPGATEEEIHHTLKALSATLAAMCQYYKEEER